ncbi:MAG TPA: extensin family protein [Xanthobacteraceae bacterium]
MRLINIIFVAILLAATAALAPARAVPLPRPRPLPPAAPAVAEEPTEPAPPTACRLRLTAALAVAPSLPPITGPGECGAPDVVRLEAVVLPDQSRVAITPPAILRCTMAEAIVSFVREEAAPRALDLGSPLKTLANLASYDCRGRNGILGARLSEHGKGNALDIHALRLADGRFVELTDPKVARDFREALRTSVCARFTTVLGPGSDGYHEDHVHVDLAERRGGYRICEWDVRDPPAAAPQLAGEGREGTTGALADTVPLPRERPISAH